MTLLLGFLLFIALLVFQLFMGEDRELRAPKCPKCGIERLHEEYDRERTFFVCSICRKRWKRGIDGALVVAEPV